MHKRFVIGLVAIAIVALLVVAAGRGLLPAALRGAAALAGYNLQTTSFQMGEGRIALTGLRVDRDGKPLFRAARIALRYSLRDLLPGSAHRFGLTRVDASGIRITLTRLANGNFNVPLPTGNSAPTGPPGSITFR